MQDLLIDNPDAKYFLLEKGIKFVSDKRNLNKKYTQIDGKIALCQKRNQQFNSKFLLENNIALVFVDTVSGIKTKLPGNRDILLKVVEL